MLDQLDDIIPFIFNGSMKMGVSYSSFLDKRVSVGCLRHAGCKTLARTVTANRKGNQFICFLTGFI